MKPETDRTYRERILKVLVYVQENLDENMSLEDLSRVSNFSSFHFHRIFKALVGEPVHKYVRRLRLERAAVGLRQSNRSITQLAFDAGFETHEAFSRAFRDMFTVSPSGFRTREGQLVKPSSFGVMLPEKIWPEGQEARLMTIPDRKIAFVRHTGPYNEVGNAFDTLLSWAAPKGLLGGGVDFLGVCYDHPEITPEDKIRFDAALTVDDDIEAEGTIGVRIMPGCENVVVCHQGPYDAVGPTYDFIYGHWLPSHNRLPSDAPPFEIYLNDPNSTEPEDLLTDVCVPLAPIGRRV